MLYKDLIDKNRIPAHIAIIMDGNGRWAKQQGHARTFGHQAGAETVHVIAEEAARLGVKYLTLYTFSTENWNRPEAEVQALMSLLVAAIHRETPDLMKNNVRLMAIGNLPKTFMALMFFLACCIGTYLLPVVAIISPALGMLLLNYILEGVFERYMSDEDREAENERNQEFYN